MGVVRSELESVLSELEAYSRYYGTVNEEIARQVGTVSKERGDLLKRVEKVRKFWGVGDRTRGKRSRAVSITPQPQL